MKIVNIYTDGSNLGADIVSWAFIVIENDTIIYQDKGFLEGKIKEIRNIGGELTAIMKAVEYCKLNNLKANIFTDLKGAVLWVDDLFSQRKPWRTNNEWTKDYRKFMFDNKNYVVSIEKVKAHSDNKFNNLVDKLVSCINT